MWAKIRDLAQFKINSTWVQKKGNSHISVQRHTLFDPILILLKLLVPMLWHKEVPPEGTQDREVQVERIVDVWPCMENEDVLPKLPIWNSWAKDFTQHEMHDFY
ncbi:hypothetical protein TSUD_316330 [Trifolium subterraneum]|uniref:Uncharacterized protein n=1 Tax=Trifolium subterraneum TaxID=3900 RepID=A0A2Z6P240_TRISU|nr:hypothetical protein TSUD_316330 [Trifolium subterraneum]